MAFPNFPQGMTLHSIGYAALKYPKLAEECRVPLNNQLGVVLTRRIEATQSTRSLANT